LIFALKTGFKDEVTFFGEGAGLHLAFHMKSPHSEERILQCAEAVKLPMMSTRCAYVREAVDHEFTIPFCTIPEDTAPALINKFRELLLR
jgi:hypothetical protein